MQDPWYPLGNGNMMIILDYALHLAQMMSPGEIDRAPGVAHRQRCNDDAAG